MSVNVKIVNKSHHQLPDYQTVLSAGMDLKANTDDVTYSQFLHLHSYIINFLKS